MWMLLALVIGGAIWFLWMAFLGTILFCGMAVIRLVQQRYISASIYGCLGAGMLLWWQGTEVIPHPYDFHEWLVVSSRLVGVVIVAVIIRAYLKHRKERMAVPAFGTLPVAEGNIVPFVKATRDERVRVMQIQDYKCANPYCNMDLRQGTPHWDHITPRSKGGTDSVHNMQWLCDTCNQNKRDMDWLEFMFRYASGMGMDPNANQKPWQKWVLTRTKNGLQCQG